MANLGLIILVGVVVNNAIVLIHHINHLREQGVSREEAIVMGRAAPIPSDHHDRADDHARPAADGGTTLLSGPAGHRRGPRRKLGAVGLVILAGMSTSTFLTLVIVPTIYSLVDDMAGYFRRVVRTA